MAEFSIDGEEVIDRDVRRDSVSETDSGSGNVVRVPDGWSGEHVKVVRTGRESAPGRSVNRSGHGPGEFEMPITHTVEDIIMSLEQEMQSDAGFDGVPFSDVRAAARYHGITPDACQAAIDELLNRGLIYEQYEDSYRVS